MIKYGKNRFRTLSIAVIAICILIATYLVFHVHQPPSPSGVSSSHNNKTIATSLATSGKAGSSPFIVKYDPTMSPKKLTAWQIEKIFRAAQTCQTPIQPIWYVMVHYNETQPNEKEPFCNTTVFFQPQATKSRLRNLNAQYIRGNWFKYSESPPAGYDPIKFTKPPRPSQYVQVASADGKFHDDPAVMPDNMQPFPKPNGFTDEEIIEIVDFVRSSPQEELTPQEKEYTSTTNPDGTFTVTVHGGGPPLDGDEPILSIHKKEDGSVGIKTGSIQANLCGSGQNAICVKKNGKWVALKISGWVS